MSFCMKFLLNTRGQHAPSHGKARSLISKWQLCGVMDPAQCMSMQIICQMAGVQHLGSAVPSLSIHTPVCLLTKIKEIIIIFPYT